MALEWNERLMSTGVDEVDTQHKQLIDKLNELFDALESGAPDAKVKDMLNFVGQYATWHFSKEEDCMDQYECPFAEANKEAHATFLGVFQGIAERVEAEGVTSALAIETQQEVANWVRNHIIKIDTKLRPCAAAAS
jgi:hemerythrin